MAEIIAISKVVAEILAKFKSQLFACKILVLALLLESLAINKVSNYLHQNAPNLGDGGGTQAV